MDHKDVHYERKELFIMQNRLFEIAFFLVVRRVALGELHQVTFRYCNYAILRNTKDKNSRILRMSFEASRRFFNVLFHVNHNRDQINKKDFIYNVLCYIISQHFICFKQNFNLSFFHQNIKYYNIFKMASKNELKVIGAGFGRTGTTSLQKALEILGVGPCYHLNEIIDGPDEQVQVCLGLARWTDQNERF